MKRLNVLPKATQLGSVETGLEIGPVTPYLQHVQCTTSLTHITDVNFGVRMYLDLGTRMDETVQSPWHFTSHVVPIGSQRCCAY